MEDIQELLFAALKKMNSEEAKQILIDHPELTNVKRIDNAEQEVTTPLIEACRYSKYFSKFKELSGLPRMLSMTGLVWGVYRVLYFFFWGDQTKSMISAG